ncbi:ankyrin repeat-containing domain protein [Pyronema domesticum]|nr:ankyrin repeat-containing domain protein [Pyronema domesticum]
MERDDDETLDTLLQHGLKLDTRLGLYKWTGMDRSLLGFILDEREGPARRRKPLPMKMLRLLIGKGKIDAMEFEAAVCSGSTEPVQMMIERSSPDTIHEFISGNEKILTNGINYEQSPACINLLLEHGALRFLNKKYENNGDTPLLRSLYWHDVKLAMMLLEKVAVKSGNLDIVQILLQYNASPNTADYEGYTPLFDAVHAGNSVLVKLLLQHNASPNITDYKGNTPLFHALYTRRLDIIEILLQHNASPNIANRQGYTPLFYAVNTKNLVLAKLLLQYNASPNTADHKGYTPLFGAVHARNTGLAKLLLQHNASPNIADDNGNTPLVSAIRGANQIMVKILLEHGANSNAVNQRTGHTPLLEALEYSFTMTGDGVQAILTQLLEHGASTQVDHPNGDSVLHTVIRCCPKIYRDTLVMLLIRYGAPVDRKNSEGLTHLEFAK